jgi:hypothetical protein
VLKVVLVILKAVLFHKSIYLSLPGRQVTDKALEQNAPQLICSRK